MHKLFPIVLFFVALNLTAQFNFEFSADISVNANGNPLTKAWTGGFNFAQFSEIDFDFDGDMDLVVFDRTTDNIKCFEHVVDGGGVHSYKFVYKSYLLFPSDIRYRLFLADYNQDGKNDIFTYGIGGVKVYKNVGNSTLGLQWELASNLLYSQYAIDINNLYVASADIPAISDIDNDGDLDILTFSLGGSHVEYHQNQSQELYGHSDSLIFEVRNECWGKFGENPVNSNIVLNDPAAACTSSVIVNPEFGTDILPKAHAGSTILAIDFDNNGVKDLILGDISSNAMVKLVNGGTAVNTNSAMTFLETNFPSNTTPVDLQLFPGAFYLDVDFDGTKDLIIGANAKSASENERSIRYYKNTGQDNLPTFIYQQNDFLQSEMIDHGTGSIPLFFDQNNDGKEDLLVANFFRYKPVLDKESSIALYRNTSATSNPELTFIDDDYLNMTNLNLGLRTVPTFGDLDGDGDKDLVVARENGNLMYFKNIGTIGNAIFDNPIQPMLDNTGSVINHGTFIFPQLFDLNNDNKLDLIVGKRNGTLVYYENTGTIAAPIFTLKNTQLGNVFVANISPDGYAAPHFFRHDDTTYLFCGAFDGKLHYYNNIDDNLNQDSSFFYYSPNFLTIDSKGYSSFWVNDFDEDGLLDLFVGHDLGGLMHLEVDLNSTSTINELEKDKFLIYPNPSNGKVNLRNHTNEVETIKAFDILGKEIELKWSKMNGEIQIDFSEKVEGVTILNIEMYTQEIYTERIIVTKAQE